MALFEDAKTLASLFDLKLTAFSKENIPMCGFPVTVIEKYKKLLSERNVSFVVVGRTSKKVEKEKTIDAKTELYETFQRLDVLNLTPIQAIQTLMEWKSRWNK